MSRDGVELRLPGPRPRALLTLLLLSANERRSSDRIAEELWDGNPPATARSSLQMHVHALREALAGLALETVAGGYVLAIDPDSVDAHVFERRLGEARRASGKGDPDAAARRAGAALAMWHGGALEQFADAAFAHTEALRLEELRLEALELRLAADLALGRHAQVVAELTRLVDLHPDRERLRAHLILALYRSGRQADALAEFQRARRYLVEELGIEPGEELRALQAAVLAQDASIGAHSDARPPVLRRRSRLPAPPTPTVGRDGELAQLEAVLAGSERRLTTVLGPGGVGKTRLALEAGRALQDAREDGVRFVGLASVADAQDVAYALALALELPGVAPSVTEQTVVRYLAGRDTLLILDNFEHVVEAAPLVAGIVAEAPAVTILTTSRSPLHIRAEQLFPLAPLDVTGSADPAVELFLDIVRARDPGYAATDEERLSIADLCRRLDGLPLAIELAAGRVGSLSVAEVASELGNGLDVLGDGPRDAPHRQRTMQATLEWSHDRLQPEEQATFARLAVFAGGASPAVAAEVTASGGEAIEHLADKQLVAIRKTADGARRVVMLETVRVFAGALLAGRDDAEAVRARHAARFAVLAEKIAHELRHTDSAAVATALERDIDNVRAALTWSLDRSEVALSLRLASAFQEYLWPRSPQEGERWLRAALALPGGEGLDALRADALWRVAMIPVWLPGQADVAEAETAARSSFALFGDCDDQAGCANARIALASLLVIHQRIDEARTAASEAVDCARAADDPIILADALNVVAASSPGFADLMAAGEEAIALYAAAGNAVRCTTMTTGLSYYALAAGEDDTAARLLAEADGMLRRVDSPLAAAMVNGNQGMLALLRGNHDDAVMRFRDVVIYAAEIPVETYLSEAVDGLAAAAVARGDPEHGARLHGAAHRLNTAPHHPAIAERLRGGFFGAGEERIGADAWRAAVEAGGRLDLEEIVALSLANFSRIP